MYKALKNYHLFSIFMKRKLFKFQFAYLSNAISFKCHGFRNYGFQGPVFLIGFRRCHKDSSIGVLFGSGFSTCQGF